MYKFESCYKDEYSRLIDGLAEEISELSKKKEPRIYKEKTPIPDTVFLTEVDNDDYNVIREVTPNVRKNDWKYTVVQK